MKRHLVNITIPVLNEAKTLERCIETLATTINTADWDLEIVIADNGSTDQTLDIAHCLARKYSHLRVLHLDTKGRGRALKRAWSESSAEILSYMDVDLSTDLKHLPGLIEPLAQGQFDLAVGSRLLRPDLISRGLKREIISRCYNFLVKAMFRTHFSDAQCGFKAITKTACNKLLCLVEDNGWFMDTELLVLAEKMGCRVLDVPVHWIEDTDSRVELVRTAVEDLQGLLRVRRNLAHGKIREHNQCAGAISCYRSQSFNGDLV